MIPYQSPVVVRDFTQFYIDNLKETKAVEKTYHIFTNMTVDLKAVWFDASIFPETDQEDYAVILAYRYDGDYYEVCYYDGKEFKAMRNGESFNADIWSYLPDTPEKI